MKETEILFGYLSAGFFISLFVLIAGILCSLWIFFRYNIRSIYRIRSGRVRQKKIRQIREKNGYPDSGKPAGQKRKADVRKTAGQKRKPDARKLTGQGRKADVERTKGQERETDARKLTGQERKAESWKTEKLKDVTEEIRGYESEGEEPAGFVITEHIRIIHTREVIGNHP